MKAIIAKHAETVARGCEVRLLIGAFVSVFLFASQDKVQAQELLKSSSLACEDFQQVLANARRDQGSGQAQLASAGSRTNISVTPQGCRWFKAGQVVVVLRRQQERHAACITTPGYRNAMDETFENADEPDCFWALDNALAGGP